MTVSGGVPCDGSGGKDSVVGVLGCVVVWGGKGSESHLSCPACEGVNFGGSAQL